MKLLGNEESADSSQRPQIRTSQEESAVGYGFHHQENEFPAFVQKRWPGTDDAVDVNIISLLLLRSLYYKFYFFSVPHHTIFCYL
jgi:hypothetical protein